MQLFIGLGEHIRGVWVWGDEIMGVANGNLPNNNVY